VGHQDSHQVAQGPLHASSSSAFAAGAHLPYHRPLHEAPPQTHPPPIVARPSRHTLAHAAPADARHQHGVLWHPDASEEQHLPPPSVGYALSYGKHALPPLRAE